MIFHGGTHRSYGLKFNKLVTSVTCLQACQSEFGTTLATGVSTWADQSAGAKDYTQATGGAQPALIQPDSAGLNGYPCLRFDGTNDTLVSALNLTAPGTTPTFIWFVARVITWNISRRLFGASTGGGNSLVVFCNTTTPNISSFNGTATTNNSGATVGQWVRGEVLFNNATSDYTKLAGTTQTGVNAGNGAAVAARTIASANNTNFCNMDLASVMYFNGKPSAGELALLDSAVIAKYGNKARIT